MEGPGSGQCQALAAGALPEVSVGPLGVGLGSKWAVCALYPSCQPLAPPFEAACLLNPPAVARVGRRVGSASLGRAGRGHQGPERGLG